MCQLNRPIVGKLKFYWKYIIHGPIAALLPDDPISTDADCIAYFKLYEKNGLDNLTQMYKIRRKMGESIVEAFNNVRNTFLEILHYKQQ